MSRPSASSRRWQRKHRRHQSRVAAFNQAARVTATEAVEAAQQGHCPLGFRAVAFNGRGVVSFEEPVAPPMPSRPVRPPKSTMASPSVGAFAADMIGSVAPDNGTDFHAFSHVILVTLKPDPLQDRIWLP